MLVFSFTTIMYRVFKLVIVKTCRMIGVYVKFLKYTQKTFFNTDVSMEIRFFFVKFPKCTLNIVTILGVVK